jgi:hypothetical protein
MHNTSEKDRMEDQILRRIFHICYLCSPADAKYRLRLNPLRQNDVKTASDYIQEDYDYVVIKRSTRELICQALVDLHGPRIQRKEIELFLEELIKRPHRSLISYTMNNGCLVADESSECCIRSPAFRDICPRTNNPQLCVLVAYLKEKLPDLMGSIQDLVPLSKEKIQNSEYLLTMPSCLVCLKEPRQCVLLPCQDLVLCLKCSKNVTNCPRCYKTVTSSVTVKL